MDAEEVVRLTEAAYQSQDVERVLQLFHPEVVVYWGGRKLLEGLEEVRAWHEGWLPARRDFKMRKTLKAASGDIIAVEWHGTYTDENGYLAHSYGGEFWQMRDGLLWEWRAYSANYVEDNEGAKQ